MNPRQLMFLDLEDTVIGCFDYYGSVSFKNIELVKSLIKEFHIDAIGIFSFALYTEKERTAFCLYTLPDLNEHINKDVSLPIHTIKEDLIPLFRKSQKNYYSTVRKFLMGLTKRDAFLHYVNLLYPHDNVLLLDDMVKTETIDEENRTCILMNVYEIKETLEEKERMTC